MKKIVLALAASALLAAPVFAQEAKPDAATVAAVRDLMESMKISELMEQMAQRMAASMSESMRKQTQDMLDRDQKLTPEQKAAAIDKMEKALPSIIKNVTDLIRDPQVAEEMVNESTAIYARHFTLAEIQELRAFYARPIGKKLLSEMPTMMPEIVMMSQKVLMPRMAKLSTEVAKDFKR